jgi:hypothetical protein
VSTGDGKYESSRRLHPAISELTVRSTCILHKRIVLLPLTAAVAVVIPVVVTVII